MKNCKKNAPDLSAVVYLAAGYLNNTLTVEQMELLSVFLVALADMIELNVAQKALAEEGVPPVNPE